MNAKLKKGYILGCVAVTGVALASAVAETTGEDANPYSVISQKNVFHLNPPPPPPSAEAAKPPELPKVKLSGFQKVGDRVKVYLAVVAKDPKDTAYLALQTGEKEKDVEIVKIRPDRQEVDIVNSGTPMTLSILRDGFALSSGGAIAKAGGEAAPGPPGIRRMGGLPGGPRMNLPAAGAPSPASGGNAAIIVGGGGNDGGSPGYANAGIGSYGGGGGAVVTGGSAPFVETAAVPNTPAAQIANTLFNGGATGIGYRMPDQNNAPPAPTEVQAAGLLIHQAAGGPPAPTGIEGPLEGPPGPQ